MLHLIIDVVIAVGFFVFGVLFGRRNPNKVNAVVDAAKAAETIVKK